MQSKRTDTGQWPCTSAELLSSVKKLPVMQSLRNYLRNYV